MNEILDSFIYCVSLLGVTGARTKLPEELPTFIANVRKHVDKPLCIGFGVSSRELFVEVSALGDGVVVGSSIIKALQQVFYLLKITYNFQGCKEQ